MRPFSQIVDSVTVRVDIDRIGPNGGFRSIRKSVAVRVFQQRIRPEGIFQSVVQSVAVGIACKGIRSESEPVLDAKTGKNRSGFVAENREHLAFRARSQRGRGPVAETGAFAELDEDGVRNGLVEPDLEGYEVVRSAGEESGLDEFDDADAI